MFISLRKIKKDDLKMLMMWRMLPEITKYMYTDPKLTMEDQMRWFKKIEQDKTCKYWIVQVDGIDIGGVNFDDIDQINQRCCWAYFIADTSFRGRGLSGILECNIYDYVFFDLNLNKLWCEVFTFNKKVIALHQKYGSKIEGTLRRHIYKNGEFYDIVRMAIIKEEWNNIRSKFSYNKIIIEQ